MNDNGLYVGNIQSGKKYEQCFIRIRLMDPNKQSLGVKDNSITFTLINKQTKKEYKDDDQNEIGISIDHMDICIGNILRRKQLPIEKTFEYELKVQQHDKSIS